MVFFKPDIYWVQWFKHYAAGRAICDVGCGTGHLLRMLSDAGAVCWGIEPRWDARKQFIDAVINDKKPLQVLPLKAAETKLIRAITAQNTLVVFARPCHGSFVHKTIDLLKPGVEILYITLCENISRYNDLGKYIDKANKIIPAGATADNEVVYSLIK